MDKQEEALKLKAEGNTAFQNANHEEALKKFTQAIELDPSNHVFFSNRSAVYASMEKYPEAIEDAEQCVELNPDWAKGYSRLGTALSMSGRHNESIDAFKRGLEKDPNSQLLKDGLESAELEKNKSSTGASIFPPELLARLATHPRTSEYMKDPEFVKLFTQLQTNPALFNDPRMQVCMQVMLGDQATPMQTEQPTPPQEEPKPEPKPEPEPEVSPAQAAKLRGNEHYKAKEFDEALKCYAEAVELDPDNITYFLNSAAVCLEMGEYDGCMKFCDEAIEKGRQIHAEFKLIAKAYARKGNCFAREEKYDEAIDMYNKSLSEHRDKTVLIKLEEIERLQKKLEEEAYIDPEKALEEKTKGNDFFKQGKYPEAVKQYTEAIKRNPKDHTVYSNRAACYTKLLAYPEGLKDCDTCIELNPTFVKAFTRKGHILFFEKRYKEALEVYDQGLKLDENNEELVQGIQRTIAALNQEIQSQQTDASDEEILQKAMKDPEVQEILNDPIMRQILTQMQTDPVAAREHLNNPVVTQRLEKLVQAGVIKLGQKP